MRMLDLTDDARAYMSEMRILSTDFEGNEIMVGLTRDETLRMLEHNRRFLANDRDRNEKSRGDYLALHERHEKARLQVLFAENEARQLNGPMH